MAKSTLQPGSIAKNEPSTDLMARKADGIVPYQENTDYDSPNRDTIIPKLAIVNSTGPLTAWRRRRPDPGRKMGW